MVPYAELHCHSNLSFLDGASHPEELATEAARLGLEALALTDHDGLYGVVRFAEAAGAVGLPTAFGAELTLDRHAEPVGQADPGAGTAERHLVVLARDPRGYALLSRAASQAQMAGSKGAPRATLADLAQVGGTAAAPGDRGRWLVLTGCRKGAVPAALEAGGPEAADRELGRLVDAFGPEHVAVELWDHGDPLDSARNDALARLAQRRGLDLVATANAHFATRSRSRLAQVLAAVRARRPLDELQGWLPAWGAAHLRSGAEQARRFARYPGVVERAAELGRACAFDLDLIAPRLPPFPCPDDLDELALLRRLVDEHGAHPRRYGPRHAAKVPGAWEQVDRELAVIGQLGFPGYFLIVWEITSWARQQGIYCQGRGSAANSAVCYALGITNCDPVRYRLLFERFLAPERDGPPDIDVDIESGRREEVIQHVYERYGRRWAAQVANVITYRPRSAVRDVAGALGYAPGQQDAWAKGVDHWSKVVASAEHPLPELVQELAQELVGFPRHLGIHSGGMVLCDRPIAEVCPVEWARMPGRSVLQWDKDDCAAVGLVKFDLLGLGMLEALHGAVDLIAAAHGDQVDLADLGDEPDDPEVYAMLQRADSVGVFQVESRAQMATLPRLRPETFYDLVVEVALIRPGPIQGGAVHPYLRRRAGREPVTYLHPRLRRSLEKTLGVPLFQEQLMQMAIDVGGFSPGEADQLRRAMGAKRSRGRMAQLRDRLYRGMAANGITGEGADTIWTQIESFAVYGFPESHSISFAYLVYASAWLKRHYPAAFCAALLNAQPMGFYAPHTLVEDARRHGVEVRRPSLNASLATATLEWDPAPAPDPTATPPEQAPTRPQPAVRLGLGAVKGLGQDLAERIAGERRAGGPYASLEDLRRRVGGLGLPTLEALATAGACEGLTDPAGQALDRRRALWAAGVVAQAGPDRLPGIVTGTTTPHLPGMSPEELARADLAATGIAWGGHPTTFARAGLAARGVRTIAELAEAAAGQRVSVAGVVTHRQRPPTAGGVVFVSLEDETGLCNVVCSAGCWVRYGTVARSAPAVVVRGRVERADGALNLVAERITRLRLGTAAHPPDER